MSTKRTVTHAVADISFTDDGSAMFCGCGWDETAATPERMYELFQEHRVAAGEQRRSYVELLGDGGQRDFVINEKGRGASGYRRDAA